MAEIDPHLDAILRCLAKHQMCATYGAVAGVYGGSARSIGNSLGERRPEASWVVNDTTLEPTGYKPSERDPLSLRAKVITTAHDLQRLLAVCESSADRVTPGSGRVFKAASMAAHSQQIERDRHTLNPAEWMHERVVRSIESFEKGLDRDHEVGGRLASFGAECFLIEDVGYWGPDLISFQCLTLDLQPATLIQHYAQTNVLLQAVRKAEHAPAHRIGPAMIQRLTKRSAPTSADRE